MDKEITKSSDQEILDEKDIIELETKEIGGTKKTMKIPKINAATIKIISVTFAILFVICIISLCCIATIGAIRSIGSGRIITQERKINTFNEIQLEGNIKVVLSQSRDESVKISAEDNIIDRIYTKESNGVLKIGYSKQFPWIISPVFPRKEAIVYINIRNIDVLTINSSGEILSDGITTDSLFLNISGSGTIDISNIKSFEIQSSITGSGNIKLTGAVDSQIIKISGSGNINAFDLESKESSIDISGSGKSEVYVLDEMNINISGSGEVNYKGDARISKQNISGSGEINRVD